MRKKQVKRTTRRELELAAERMKKDRGEWVRIPTRNRHPANVVVNQRAGKIPALPPQLFESRLTGRTPQARYIGPATD